MAELRDLNATDADNTTIGGIASTGASAPSNFDNIVRAMAGMLKRMISGAAPVDDTFTFRDPSDSAKKFRFDGGSITTGNTRVITVPDSDGTIAIGASSTTDNAVARYDGTTGKMQNSGVTIDDSGNMVLPSGATITFTA